MKNLILFFTASVLIVASCNTHNETNLGQDLLIQEIFTPNEIASLSNALELYKQKILTETSGDDDFVITYRKYLDHLKQYETVSEVYNIAEINRENYSSIYDEMIGSGLFDAIYKTDTVYLNQAKVQAIRYHVSRDGKYAQLLNALAEKDTIYARHVESLRIVGDFPPSIIAWLLHENDKYDLTDQKVQLFYMLTLLKPLK